MQVMQAGVIVGQRLTKCDFGKRRLNKTLHSEHRVVDASGFGQNTTEAMLRVYMRRQMGKELSKYLKCSNQS